ncbi:hypothetical protein ARMGADRAFT_1022571 [Armillaria gallica]|uniref:Uncharacterized protein n=1 Tax=Armillaria gallica TaxID=47427 RepID=A0A2H3E9H2_ARMGA|nr:hypothetical protein ARMGADRAFT_1022571 [Armillaria gallica]
MSLALLAEHASSSPPIPPLDDSASVDTQDLDMSSLFDFESLFEDHSTPISPTLVFYHPYNDVHTLDVAIIGVLHIPSIYEYAIRLDYSSDQRLWLTNRGPGFERAVRHNQVRHFFRRVWHDWFIEWLITASHTRMTAKEYKHLRADEEHRKIEIFTLYIMGLKNRWVNGPPPENWTLSRVFAKLDELEDMITQRFKEVEHYFVEVEECWNPEDLHV